MELRLRESGFHGWISSAANQKNRLNSPSMSEPFPPTEFDQWAASYDENVKSESGFPFDGYSRVLQTVLELAAPMPGNNILDLGTGTGSLAALFSGRDCTLWGLDFSAEMLARARVKLPHALLAQVDLREVWPVAFQRRYDCIVSAYAFHHFPLDEKVSLILRLIHRHLAPGGRIVIGDIAFHDSAEENALRKTLGAGWEQEYYWHADATIAALTAVDIESTFTKISSCAGIFQITL
jgi:putative AdoMet-dependent methyltransferase